MKNWNQNLRGKDGLDGGGVWGIIATELSEKIGSDVTHFKLFEHETGLTLIFANYCSLWKIEK